MNTELERIAAEALKLSIEERERLVDSLLASLAWPCEGPESGPSEEGLARPEEQLNRSRREPHGEKSMSIDADGEASTLPFSGFATPEIERAWIEECRRRFELMKSGEMATYPAEEVMAELMADYKQ